MDKLPVIVIGAGGHAKVLIDILHRNGVEIVGCTDTNYGLTGIRVMGEKILGDDEVILNYPPREVHLVNALGSIGKTNRRQRIFEKYEKLGYVFETLVHETAILSEEVGLAQGAQIMAGVILQSGVHVMKNALINTGASIDHDCHISAHAHIAPRAVLNGAVSIGLSAFVGAGAVIIQGVTIGHDAVIGAGAVVLKDVPPEHKMVGVPARRIA
ncbi:MAG: acetyltransferase [Pseudomonadota bacterium]|nr:acetyltransferase [Pseudomonadota bacterium]